MDESERPNSFASVGCEMDAAPFSLSESKVMTAATPGATSARSCFR
jgi:hypothetical protein